MTATEDIASVRLTGTARERGRIQGEELRPLIARGMERWKAGIESSTGRSAEDYLDRFVEATDFMTAIECWASHLLEEVRGLAEGAGLSFRDAYTYQLMDEEWLFRIQDTGSCVMEEVEHCSVVAAAGEGEATILGQNMDLPKYYDGTQTLLRIVDEESGLESLVFTVAGLIGTCGLNSAGVGLCVNTLAQLSHSSDGLPVAFVARGVIERQTVADATCFVEGVRHASGQNYAIAGPDSLVDLECSAGHTVRFMDGASRLCHTNHPLINDDVKPASNDRASTRSGPSDTERRFELLADNLADHARPLDVERAMTLLSTRDVPISKERDDRYDSMTMGSLVMELSAYPVLHLAAGPPAETRYRRYTF